MPRGKRLTEREIGKIEALRQEGQGIREIARKIGRTPCLVSTYLKNPDEYGKKLHKAGRKKEAFASR